MMTFSASEKMNEAIKIAGYARRQNKSVFMRRAIAEELEKTLATYASQLTAEEKDLIVAAILEGRGA